MSKNNKVDKYGIRLAPAPLDKAEVKSLPTVVQPYEIAASVSMTDVSDNKVERGGTKEDFQPETSDVTRPYKRVRRIRNFFAGLLMIIVCGLTIAPFILGYFGVELNLPFVYSFKEFNVLGGLHNAIQITIDNGASGPLVNEAWIQAVPSLILTVGLIAIVINLLKAISSLFGAIKARSYGVGTVIYIISVLCIFIAALVGAEMIGINQIDFMVDFIGGWQTSELVTLFMIAALNVVGAVLAKIISPNNSGY